MIAVAERLPEALCDGFFDDIDDWLSEEVAPTEPEPHPLDRIDRRRFEAMRDAHGAPAFAAVAVRLDGGHYATVLVEDDVDRSELAAACERLAAAIRNGSLEASGGRAEWESASCERGGMGE